MLIDTAPPKPAPDAMREAGVRFWRAAKAVALHKPLAKQVCHVPTALMRQLIDAMIFFHRSRVPIQEIESESMFHDRVSDEAAALRHATVPPADGAAIKSLCDEIERLRGVASDVRLLHAAGRFKEYDGEPWLTRAAAVDLQRNLIAEVRALSPPCTGAADRSTFYSILSTYIPSESIDSAWQELRESGLVP